MNRNRRQGLCTKAIRRLGLLLLVAALLLGSGALAPLVLTSQTAEAHYSGCTVPYWDQEDTGIKNDKLQSFTLQNGYLATM